MVVIPDLAGRAAPSQSKPETRMYNRWIVLALAFQVLALALFSLEFAGTLVNVPALQFSWQVHEFIELSSILALATGSAISLFVLRLSLQRAARVEEQLGLASSSFHSVVMRKFDEWGFSDAERDIAILTIKGMSIADIAAARGKSVGTIKAQNSSIYQKSGLPGRVQFVSYFLELLTEGF